MVINIKELQKEISDLPHIIGEEEYQETKRVYQRLPMLFKKSKGLITDYKKLKSFKEPCALLMRVGGNVEFYENVKGDEYAFEHSNSKKCKIRLTARGLKNFDYGGTKFKGYILDENKATPILDGTEYSDYLSSELMESTIQKYSVEREKLALETAKAQAKTWMNVFIGVALVILAVGVYKMMVPGGDTTVVQAVVENITNVTAAIPPEMLYG